MVDISKLKGRGRSLYLAVSNSKYSNKDAAGRAGYRENTFYQHIKQELLDFKIMVKYAMAIGFDFSYEYPEIKEYQVEDPNDRVAKLSRPYLELQQKYTSLLENNNELLIDNNKKEQDINGLKEEINQLKKEIKTLKGKK